MFILCKGNETKKPYTVPVTGVEVYSLEELCYYIYNNIYQVNEEFFVPKLVEWIREEVGEVTTAKKMKSLIEGHNDIKDMVVTLLCACDYYKKDEVSRLVEVMKSIENLPAYKKNKLRADNTLISGRYEEACFMYGALIKSGDADKFSEEEVAQIIHNRAISLFHVSSFEEAAAEFYRAYSLAHNMESLNCFMYICLLLDKKGDFVKAAVQSGVSEATCDEMMRNVEIKRNECEATLDRQGMVDELKNDYNMAFGEVV